jgi:two-component system OmpR family sensor kinase
MTRHPDWPSNRRRPGPPPFACGTPALGERMRRLRDHFHAHLRGLHDWHELHEPGHPPHDRQAFRDRHPHRRPGPFGQRWRRFCGASLRRRLFIWFGAAIFVTAMLNVALVRLALDSPLRGRVPPALFLVIPLVVLWAASGRVARRIARPLSELVDVARDIGGGQMGARARLHWRGIDEIGELSRAINDMAERIERQISDQRELLAGVSHEIRTPLARLRLLVEIGREQGRQAMNLDDFEREVIEIDGLVGELLASARLDFSALSVLAIDARDLARDALERAGIGTDRLEVSARTGSLGFAGDPTLLGRALANLLRNAVVHGLGVERLVVTADAHTVAFTVTDRGPGFPPGEERRVFDRFYRPQRRDVPAPDGTGGGSGRTTGPRPGRAMPETTAGHPDSAAGLGLGLALVRRIAEAHGGEAMARNGADGGAEVSMVLPRVPVEASSDTVA